MEKFQKQEEKGWDQSRALKGGFLWVNQSLGRRGGFRQCFRGFNMKGTRKGNGFRRRREISCHRGWDRDGGRSMGQTSKATTTE